MNYTIAKNNQFNSIEINFSGKPCEAIRSALKNIGFRWNSVRRIWYGYTKMQNRIILDDKTFSPDFLLDFPK